MKKIKLNNNVYTIVSDEDYPFLISFKWKSYVVTGSNKYNKKYIYGYKVGTLINKKQIWLHNFILKPKKGYFVDHIDGNTLNNQRENLRLVTHRQNSYNRSKCSTKKSSKYKGVSKYKNDNKFTVRILRDRKCIYHERFSLEKEAAMAYDKKAIEFFGEYAKTNFKQKG